MAKLKKILSELNWGGYKIHPGQVVTYKDFPAFKTEKQISEEETKTDEWVAFKILNNSPKKKLIKVLGSHRAAKFWATKNTAKLFVLDDTIQSVGIQSMESWKTDLWK
jgi:hypothetical protein